MANTGIKIVLTLDEYQEPYPPGTYIESKPNDPTDPDYIAPYQDLVACPITTDTTCPYFLATGMAGSIQYELSLTSGVVANTNISKILIIVWDSTNTTQQATQTITLPLTPVNTYTYGTITSIPTGTHNIDIQYLNSSDVVQATCTGIATGIITT